MSIHVLDEANRCLHCKAPQCQKGCPIHTPIPQIIAMLQEGRLDEAGRTLFENNPLTTVCSLVCNHENQCEGHCVLGKKGAPVHFSAIENYISSTYSTKMVKGPAPSNGMRVAIVRKPIKNMYLRIKPPNADIVISAPQRMSQSAIERFVTERKPWIERAQRSMRQARDAQLNAQRAQNGNIGDTGASANPPAFVWTDEAKARAQRNIESQLPVLLAKWGPIVGRTPTHITLRLMSSRWGSCTPKTGRIRLNLQLGLMAPRFLEYVLVHEMTHLWENGHGEGFQRRMSAYLPQWRQLRRDINRQVVL